MPVNIDVLLSRLMAAPLSILLTSRLLQSPWGVVQLALKETLTTYVAYCFRCETVNVVDCKLYSLHRDSGEGRETGFLNIAVCFDV